MPGFDVDKFMATRFALRTASVKVPELAAMFPEGADPVFEVRGLDGVSWGKAQESIRKRRDIATIQAKIASGKAGEIAEAVRESLGLNDELAAVDALGLEIFHRGVVRPEMSEVQALDVAKRLLKHFPAAFKRITDKIANLTGASDQGEAGDSGATPKSESP